jgi:hypothetical protein
VTDEEEKGIQLGSSTGLGETERDVVVASPRRGGADDLVRMDIPLPHTAPVAKKGLPGRLDDDSKGLWSLGRSP